MPAVARLARIAAQLAPSGAAAAKERPYAELGSSADGPLKLLDDDQMQQFLGAGFLTLPIDELGEEFHDALYDKAKVEFGPDNNGLRGTGGSTERIPELLTMVNSPTVAGALVSILGENYAHGHLGVSGCALHVSTGEDQIFHKVRISVVLRPPCARTLTPCSRRRTRSAPSSRATARAPRW